MSDRTGVDTNTSPCFELTPRETLESSGLDFFNVSMKYRIVESREITEWKCIQGREAGADRRFAVRSNSSLRDALRKD